MLFLLALLVLVGSRPNSSSSSSSSNINGSSCSNSSSSSSDSRSSSSSGSRISSSRSSSSGIYTSRLYLLIQATKSSSSLWTVSYPPSSFGTGQFETMLSIVSGALLQSWHIGESFSFHLCII
ncbi:hypothetical protein ElyMa_000323000 [Elysia marginata]|uniref:REJ domain-containing protein n=1 Tax=Elysia marginata TaxID=1093978 RepID=A0AAV4FA64_9GAST|nr:hypothetical protein ElyMa_000323000 [Elysia marginata]